MSKKICPLDIRKGMTIADLIREYEKGAFGSGTMAEAVETYAGMLTENCTVFLGLAGALVPSGLGKIVADLIRDDMVHVVVTTGANATHDLIEAFGGSHYKGVVEDDSQLREKGIDRIYDAFIADESFRLFEKKIGEILPTVKGDISVSDLMREIGRHLASPYSFVRQAFLKEVPVFVPAFTDSILGLHTFLYAQDHHLIVDHVKDIGRMVELTSSGSKAGAIFLGGGVPKNFIFQAMLLSPRTFEYALQITTDRPEYGGLSGATLEEAISWGKVSKDSRLCTCYCDATIGFPLIVAGVRDALQK
ncbi:MAG: deoxyhypusine synthase [Theionarchaea archaeon]|nr:deoxyhypusine synthase [Theionarchaea archaeon]MBU7038297.1 deoxyhypusine synthase [Theionarchaea archaeon]